jgi:peroxiredoxin family protein
MAARRVAAIVTLGDRATFERFAAECSALARAGAQVRVFFRDESIPSICVDAVRRRLLPWEMADDGSAESLLADLAVAGDVRLYACTSSMYVWGVSSQDLIPAMNGGRGLIAFLAEDLAGASQALTY